MSKTCPNCHLVNFSETVECARCSANLIETSEIAAKAPVRLIRRVLVFAAVCFFTVFGFYLSLIMTSDPLDRSQKEIIAASLDILEQRGFSDEVFLLRNVALFRSNDNWLNASTKTETAYAATNFPFEIMTIYPEFFEYPRDDLERAAILLHEAKHLQGKDEREAYEFVWKNREKLGWTSENYGGSPIWRNIRKQTREFAPDLFVCEFNEFDDCT